ncbi:unnamed protein product [Caenorhabditis nigoni]
MKIPIFSIFLILSIGSAHAQHWFGGRGGGGAWKPPCGPPPFLDRLPQDAKLRISEIWKNYKTGSNCENEQSKTREIFRSMPRGAFRKPPFLEGVSKNILEKFEAIFKDRSISWDQKKSKIDFLAQNVLTGENLRKFQEFKAMKANREAEFRQKEARLSPAAQQANQKMRNLMGRERLQFMQGLDENVKQELMEMWRSRFGGAGGRRMMRNRRI